MESGVSVCQIGGGSVSLKNEALSLSGKKSLCDKNDGKLFTHFLFVEGSCEMKVLKRMFLKIS